MSKNKEQPVEKEQYASLYDIPRATIGEVRKQIQLSWQHKQHRGAFVIVGEAGVGKSQVIQQIARDEEARVYDVRTAHYGLVGAGIPSTKNSPDGYFDIVVPSVFPKKGEKSIMLFEEINQGLQHAISMFFSLVEDRRMFNYTLPDEALVVALMNPATAMYAVTQIENNAALRRRLKWLFAIESFKDWYNHAKTPRFHETDIACLGEARPCHPMVLGFIKTFPKNLYDREAQKQPRQYTCPATIQTVSLDAYVMEEAKPPISLSSNFALTRFASSIGLSMATQLVEFIKDSSTIVKTDDVLEDYKGKAKAAVLRLLEKHEEEKIAELNINILKYMFGVQPDVTITAENLVDYLYDIKNEMRVAILTQLKKYADDNDARNYLFKMMAEVQKHPRWFEIHTSIDSAQTKVDMGLDPNATP